MGERQHELVQQEILRWDPDAERDLWADACTHNDDSLWWFVQRAFGVTNPGNGKGGWLVERVHKPICDWFEGKVRSWLDAGRPGQLNLFIVVPRDFGKSVLITKAGMLWLHLQDPEFSTYIGSITKEMATEFLDPIKQVMKGEDAFAWFTWLFGNWYSKDRDWTTETVEHAVRRGTAVGEPSFGVWGAATGLVGKHPDIICFDDPISYTRMEMHSGWIDYVNRHVTSLIPVLKGNGLRIFIGTPYKDGDWIGRAIHVQKIKTLAGMPRWNVVTAPKGLWHMYLLAARENHSNVGKPIYPERWGEEQLQGYERDNAFEYWAQMMVDPTSETTMTLIRRDIDGMWVDKKDVPGNLRISIHIDTAFKVKDRQMRGDYSVITVWGHSRDGSGMVYYLDGWGSQSADATAFNNKLTLMLRGLRATARWPFILTDETEVGGKVGTWELTIVSWCAAAGLPPPNVVLLSRSGREKTSRHLAAASLWKDGKVRLVRDANGVEQMVDQMLKIGVSDHDDWADCAADVFRPEVYTPPRLNYSEIDTGQVRPYDYELKDGDLSIAGQVRSWRQARRQDNEERLLWNTIGLNL